MNETKIRVTVDMPRDQHAHVKNLSRIHKMTMQDLILSSLPAITENDPEQMSYEMEKAFTLLDPVLRRLANR